MLSGTLTDVKSASSLACELFVWYLYWQLQLASYLAFQFAKDKNNLWIPDLLTCHLMYGGPIIQPGLIQLWECFARQSRPKLQRKSILVAYTWPGYRFSEWSISCAQPLIHPDAVWIPSFFESYLHGSGEDQRRASSVVWNELLRLPPRILRHCFGECVELWNQQLFLSRRLNLNCRIVDRIGATTGHRNVHVQAFFLPLDMGRSLPWDCKQEGVCDVECANAKKYPSLGMPAPWLRCHRHCCD